MVALSAARFLMRGRGKLAGAQHDGTQGRPTCFAAAPAAPVTDRAALCLAPGHATRLESRVGTRSVARARAGELRWLLGVGLVVLGLSALPSLVAAVYGPPDLERLGTFWFARDFGQYQAAMREGARSPSWLIHNRFTAEPHAPALVYPFYVALGKLAAALGVDDLLLFSSAEWVGRVLLLGATYLFVSAFLRGVRERRLATLLIVGTLGLAGWLVPLRLAFQRLGFEELASGLPGLNVYPEVSPFGAFLAAPPVMLGLALTLVAPPLYLRARRGDARWVAALGAAVFALSALNPFNVPVLVSALLADAALSVHASRRASQRRIREPRLQPLLAAGAAALAAAPLTLYYVALFQLDPFWSGTYGSAQNLMPSSAPWTLPIDLGLVLLAAPLAWTRVRSWEPAPRRLLLVWTAVTVIGMYLPVPYQRRLALGLQPALAVLAAAGLLAANAWMHAQAWGPLRRRLANYTATLAVALTPVLVYAALIGSAASNQPAEVYVWSRAEADAARWLGARSGASDVVLAETRFANPLPGLIDGRVVMGHVVATRESARKEALVERFYAADTTVAERSELLRETRATIVALGPRERALGAPSLADQPELELIYDREGVQWYRVRG